MGTRARIGIIRGDEVESIYTHWDGYPSHHGPVLRDHWTNRDRVERLIALGDLSSLGSEIGEAHDFDAPHDDPVSGNWCLAYGRDRGEENVGAEFHGRDDWPDSGQDYEYLYGPEGWQWRERLYNARAEAGAGAEYSDWLPLTLAECGDWRTVAAP